MLISRILQFRKIYRSTVVTGIYILIDFKELVQLTHSSDRPYNLFFHISLLHGFEDYSFPSCDN